MKLPLFVVTFMLLLPTPKTHAVNCELIKVRDAFECLQKEITDLRVLLQNQEKTIVSVKQSYSELKSQNEQLQVNIRSLDTEIGRLGEQLHNAQKVPTSRSVNVLKNLPPPKVQDTATSKSLKFDLTKCIKNNENVLCTVWVTDTASDTKSFRISYSTEIYNEFGVKSLISSVTAGGRVFDMGPRKRMEYSLVKNVPLEVTLQFDDVDSASTQITALNIIGNKGDTRSNYQADLRSIVLL